MSLKIQKHKSVFQYVFSPEITDIAFCGDIHGEFNTIVNKFCKQYDMRNSVLVICGDCGFGYYKYKYYTDLCETLDKILKEYNNYIVCLRGNHDSPVYFNDINPFHSERIFCVPDYSVITLKYRLINVLCVGGAISVDRQYTIEQTQQRKRSEHYNGEECYRPKSYWKNEGPVYSEEKLEEISELPLGIDIIATHSCPSFVGITDKISISHWLENDSTLSEDIDNERRVFDKILKFFNKELTVSKWYYGHYHKSMNEQIAGIIYNMLDINEIKFLNSWDI